MFPGYCSAMGLAGWLVTLLVWAALVSLAVWGIARLFPSRDAAEQPAPPPAPEIRPPDRAAAPAADGVPAASGRSPEVGAAGRRAG